MSSRKTNIYGLRPRIVKLTFIFAALLITAGSLVISRSLVSDLEKEEQSKVEIWAQAMQSLQDSESNADLNLVLSVLEKNKNIPVVVQDSLGNITEHRNIEMPQEADSLLQVAQMAAEWRQAGREVVFGYPGGGSFTVSYGESLMLQRLAIYPYIQLAVVAVFIFLAIYALLSSKRAEQNKVWVGLSRETAHQLGTPTSSLMAWTEVLRESYPDEPIITDMSQDVERLQLIADRFSKIGSAPVLEVTDVGEVVSQTFAYMSRRASNRVQMQLERPNTPVEAPLNAPLFAWVIENLCKNAIDAMSGSGSITVGVTQQGRRAVITVTDTGKGIPRSKFKTVFKPGFTTKQRGWGLGLSLARRIITEYHGGEIFVKQSEPGIGTTFCIHIPLKRREAGAS